MNRFLFATALAALTVSSALAGQPPVAPAPIPGTPPPVVGSTIPLPMVQNTLIEPPHRMGLFARMRARRTTPMLSTTMAYPAVPTVSAPVGVPAPMTMPATAPGKTSQAAPGVTGEPVVVGSTMTTPTPDVMTTSTVQTGRMGLVARLRMRRAQ